MLHCQNNYQISAKQGSTFHWAGTITLPIGTWTAKCSVVQSGTRNPIGNIVVTLGTPVMGVYPIDLFASGTDTLAWNVPKMDCDILFKDNSTIPNIYPSPTFEIVVDRQVTVE